tara:strand:+ start:195 stop:596 length:402 start_codon:yes stop_codon:yes gene_type:complete
MAYFYQLNQGTRTDGTQFRSVILTDKPLASARTVKFGSQTTNVAPNKMGVKYMAWNPVDENAQAYAFDNPFWDTVIKDCELDMDNPVTKPEGQKDNGIQGFQGKAIEVQGVEISENKVVNSNGVLASNLYYAK